MLDPARIYATALYIASIIVALFCAVYVSDLVLILSYFHILPIFSCLHSILYIWIGPQQAIDAFGNYTGVWCAYLVCLKSLFFLECVNWIFLIFCRISTGLIPMSCDYGHCAWKSFKTSPWVNEHFQSLNISFVFNISSDHFNS